MFKRVEKRLKKRQEEIKLGIDEETRDILGLNDTDSDESESEPSEGENEGSSSENGSEEEWGGIEGNRVDGEEESGSCEEDGDEEDQDEEEGPRHVAFQVFTAQQALDEPIYTHPTQSNAQLCAICPGKTLIHPLVISDHLASKAHERRSRHIANLASLPEHADSSLSDLMQLMDGIQPRTAGEGTVSTSGRAEKKRKAVEIRNSMREKKKAREREKKKEREKESEERHALGDDQKPAKAPAASSSKKDKSKDRLKKPESAKIAQDKQPESSMKKAAEKATMEKPRNDKKRKKGAEKRTPDSDVLATDDRHAPTTKKRKTNDEGILKEEVAQQIKDIAKSATVRARLAQSKAKQNDGKNKPKTKKGSIRKEGTSN